MDYHSYEAKGIESWESQGQIDPLSIVTSLNTLQPLNIMDRERKIKELEAMQQKYLQMIGAKTSQIGTTGQVIHRGFFGTIKDALRKKDDKSNEARKIADDYLKELYKEDTKLLCLTVQKAEKDEKTGLYLVLCSLYVGEELDKVPHMLTVDVDKKKVIEMKLLKESL